MSPDENFAAQMWTWPGPMLKRDASGRVIVVNAAFLQLYGGRVEDWAGNAVTGWPAPQAPGSATRFESRIPQADGSEIVYDWVEATLADGSALSLARDVTVFVAQAQQAAPPPPPVQEQPPVQHQAPAQQAFAEAPPAHQPPAVPPAQELAPPPVQEAPPAQAPVEQASAAAPPAAQEDPFAAPAAEIAAPPPATPQTPPAAESAPQPERDFERRALPIEDGDSVLGNNWRDAVIAKALGVEDAPAEDSSDQDDDADGEEEEEKRSPNDGVRILLAEDNAINALLTRTLLEAEGCAVDVVEDGSLAVEAMRKTAYDMIFMDMRMPNMDGLEATRKIRAMDHRSKGLPIVALTANAFDDDRNACFDSGMNDFMTKPVSAEELSEMVRVHTSKQEERIAS